MNILKYLTIAAYSYSICNANDVDSGTNIINIGNSDKTVKKCQFRKSSDMAYPKWTCYDVSVSALNNHPAPTPAAWKNLRVP
ncbi:hypothetical protein [Sodalis praecaptivus]|uniref:hypothetical protein n=1 Tax=Sodalis praecaptivus TaxID=1239307 RepID=UPI00280A5354|nr:hypothetical protein [Sodalis praecaptivus]